VSAWMSLFGSLGPVSAGLHDGHPQVFSEHQALEWLGKKIRTKRTMFTRNFRTPVVRIACCSFCAPCHPVETTLSS
jgi:hypothetical protein